MKIETIAEYVGDDQTITLLTELGVDYGQGYAIDKPSPVEPELALSGAVL